MTQLQSLEDYNNERLKQYGPNSNLTSTGIACPQCGTELEPNVDLHQMVMTNPPRQPMRCPKCEYQGSRII